MLKEIIRRVLWLPALLCDGEFVAEEGTVLARFFNWVYGEDERDDHT